MQRIYEYWFDKYHNVGDLLGPYIVSHLAEGPRITPMTYVTKLEALRIIMGGLLRLRRPDTVYIRRLFVQKRILFSIGSILDHSNKNIDVWGAGFQNEGETCKGGRFYAVRGKKSLLRLQELGYVQPNGDIAIGDPAILLPLFYKPTVAKKYDLGIVAHSADFEYLTTVLGNNRIIPVETDDIESFANDLNECKKILSTSLHGLIIAHSYGIPAIWIKKNWVGSDGFKFYDYFSSVGICDYKPLDVDDVAKMDIQQINSMFENNNQLPISDIKFIQQRLIKTAPFVCRKSLLS